MPFVKDIKQDTENSHRGKEWTLLGTVDLYSWNYNNVSQYLKKEINFWPPELAKII
jgi:hypothetical protein